MPSGKTRKNHSTTKMGGIPPEKDMREARRQRRYDQPDRKRDRFFAVSNVSGATEAQIEDIRDIGACRAALAHIVASRGLKPRRGSPLNVDQLRAALDAVEQARVPFRGNRDGSAAKAIAEKLELKPEGAFSLLRRLLDLRDQVTGREKRTVDY